jgi:Toprim domain
MGGLLSHAVCFGAADDVLAVGEGIETMLSLRCALPAMPMAAALSANHLAALLLPPTLRRLYIARDADAAGDLALAALTERAEAAGIEALGFAKGCARSTERGYCLPMTRHHLASSARTCNGGL